MKGWPTMKSTVANNSTNSFKCPHQPERLIMDWDAMVALALNKYNWLCFPTWRTQALISNFHGVQEKFSYRATTHTFFILKLLKPNSGPGSKLRLSNFVVNKNVTLQSVTSFHPAYSKQVTWLIFIENFLLEFLECF